MAGFIDGIKAAGYTIKEAKVAGFSFEGLRLAGFACAEVADTCKMTCHEARVAGYTAAECKAAGWSWKEIEQSGYSIRQVKPTIGNTALSATELLDSSLLSVWADSSVP